MQEQQRVADEGSRSMVDKQLKQLRQQIADLQSQLVQFHGHCICIYAQSFKHLSTADF